MDLEIFEKNQALTAWRDRLELAAWALVNESGKRARACLEKQLHEAGIQNSIWDPSHFAHHRIDSAMRETLETALGALLARAAEELHELDPSFRSICDVLVANVTELVYPKTPTPKPKQEKAGQIIPDLAPVRKRFSAITDFVTQKVVPKGALEWSERALEQINEVADAANHKLQNNIGLHDRLRRAAAERIGQAWMSDHGEHRPLMAQIIASVDDLTNRARRMTA